MKEWFVNLIDDLKFLGAECKREFSDLELTPASELPKNPSRPETAYVLFYVKVPWTNAPYLRKK